MLIWCAWLGLYLLSWVYTYSKRNSSDSTFVRMVTFVITFLLFTCSYSCCYTSQWIFVILKVSVLNLQRYWLSDNAILPTDSWGFLKVVSCLINVIDTLCLLDFICFCSFVCVLFCFFNVRLWQCSDDILLPYFSETAQVFHFVINWILY